MKTKLTFLFVALIATTALWASNTITYTATSKLSGYYGSLDVGATTFGPAITSHTFANGTGTITCNGEITMIGDDAFRSCSGMTSVTIPNSVTTIGDYAFYNCSKLTSVTIPNSVTTIGDDAFYNCYRLTSVTIPNFVTTIGYEAFVSCSGLTSVTIPNSVTTIGEYAFDNVNNIIYYGTATGSPWGAKCVNGYVDGYLVYSDATKTKLCGCSSAVTGEIVIPNSVTTIGNWAFYYCIGLTSVTIPNSVTTIGAWAFGYVNNIVYNGTAKWSKGYIENLYWGAKCMNGYVDGYWVYRDATKTELCGCPSAATGNISIHNSVTTIGECAFLDCSSLTSVTIPNSVTTIGNWAFLDCSSLTSVTIPNSVISIGEDAFEFCFSIEKVYISNPYPFETKDPVVIVNPIITKAFTATNPQYILQNVGHISTDNTPTCVLVHVDLSEMETARYAKMALDFAGTKYELNTKESTVILTGLTPASSNQATFYSQLIGESQWREGATIEISTGDLTLTTLTPKVVSAGTAVVAAETNISDYETNVGFEWRKYDAPSTMPSKSGAAILYNGMMEGKLLNLGTDSYWNVRPYYEAADGTRYYGEWITFDPGDFSYFEPTVHTYALETLPTSSKVQVRGYVMTGTEEVTEQGFEYWFKGAKAPRRVASATPDSIYRVQASGQVMMAVLEDLAYSTTYTCRAYAVAGGKTYYGEEVQFLTPEDPRPIYTLYVMAGENGSVNTDVSGQYREGETVTLTATAEQGFRFVQWSDGNTDNPRQLTITANTELMAFFELADGLEQLTIDNAQCTIRKMIIDNQLYIFRGDKIYNAAGGLIK